MWPIHRAECLEWPIRRKKDCSLTVETREHEDTTGGDCLSVALLILKWKSTVFGKNDLSANRKTAILLRAAKKSLWSGPDIVLQPNRFEHPHPKASLAMVV